MKRERFMRQRREDWQRFEELLDRLRRTRRHQWSCRELGEFSRIYRSICYDLSLVRSREWGSQLENYLNGLVAQGHNFLYRAPPQSAALAMAFLTVGFPRVVRRHRAFFFVALALFALPLIVSMTVAIQDPVAAEAIVEKALLDRVGEMYSTEFYEQIDESFANQRSYMAGFYVLNNVSVAFRCFAFGIFFGIGTVWQLLLNGILIGTMAGYVVSQGHGANFFSFVVAHGSFELTAIVISGAAGLLIGWGLVHPGNQSRWDSLRYHGREAIKLVMGAAVMLGIAALIEAFFSPMAIPDWVKYGVGSLLWLVVIAYLVFAGRGATKADDGGTARRGSHRWSTTSR